MSGLASPVRLRPQVFSTSRRFGSSAASLPALFHAGSAHGVAPFRALFLPRGRTPFPVPIPSWRWSLPESISSSRCSPSDRSPRRAAGWPRASLQSRNPFASCAASQPAVRTEARAVGETCRSAPSEPEDSSEPLWRPSVRVPEDTVRPISARSRSKPEGSSWLGHAARLRRDPKTSTWFERLHSLPTRSRSSQKKTRRPQPSTSRAKAPFPLNEPSFAPQPEDSVAPVDPAFRPRGPKTSLASSVLPSDPTETEAAMRPDDLFLPFATRRSRRYRTS
jgi:hypothetical protein